MTLDYQRYLDLGWSVIPVDAKTRTPFEKYKNLKDLDPAACIAVFERHPEYETIAKIIADDEIVIEIDGGEWPEMPATPTLKTPRGRHYHFKRPSELRMPGAAINCGDGFEAKATGMLMNVEGKHHYGADYEWLYAPETPMSDLPSWCIDKIHKYYETEEGTRKQMGDEELAGLLKGLQEGEGRNGACIRLGGHYVGKGLAWDEIWPILTAWNTKNRPPLPDREFQQCLKQIKVWHDLRQEEKAGKEIPWTAWIKLKEDGKLDAGAKLSSKALVEYATDKGYCSHDKIRDGWKIPAEPYNRHLWEAPVNLGHRINRSAANARDAEKLIKARDALHELEGIKNPASCAEFLDRYCKKCSPENLESFIGTHLKLKDDESLGCCELSETYRILEADYKWKIKKSKGEKDTEPEERVDPVIRAKAEEIMRSGDPIKFIIDTHQNIHVGDVELGKTLLVSIGSQSCLNSEGIQPKLNGESGKGKSHCAKVMAHLMPKKYILETSLSGKALYYKASKLPDGVVIFCDDAALNDDMQSLIKRATTAFQEGTKHTTVSKDLEAIDMTTPKRVVWWLTSVDDSESLELLNRQFGGGVDESPEQDEKVAAHQLKMAALGIPALAETEDVLVCREIIRIVKEKLFKVQIPYAEAIVWNDKSNRRNLPIFLDIVRSYAVLRFMQRHVTDNNTVTATLQDFEDAKALYSMRAENQALKLRDAEIKLCEILNDWKDPAGATQEELSLAYGCKTSTGRPSSHIRNLLHGKTKKDTGLMDKVNIVEDDTTESISNGDESERHSSSIRLKKYRLIGGFDRINMFANVVYLDKLKLNNIEHQEHLERTLRAPNEIDNSKDISTNSTKFENIQSKNPEKVYVRHIENEGHTGCKTEKVVRLVLNSHPIPKPSGALTVRSEVLKAPDSGAVCTPVSETDNERRIKALLDRYPIEVVTPERAEKVIAELMEGED